MSNYERKAKSMKEKKLPWPKQPAQSGIAGLLRTTCALRLLLLLLLTLPAGVQAQFNYATNNGTITIVGYTGPGGVVAIPDTINGLPVTGIGDWAFYLNTNLTSVTIPGGVTNLGRQAFGACRSLSSVMMASGVISIRNEAFHSCRSLANVVIPNSVTSIGNSAFDDCRSLASVTIGSGVTSIGNYAFFGCTNLMSFTIPNNVTNVGDSAFRGCSSLASVTIPSSVTSIGVTVFSYCASLTAITLDVDNSTYGSVDGVLFNKSLTALIQCPGGKTGNYTIPSSVTSIVGLAFTGCTSLTSVTIPNSVTIIGRGAFIDCSSLASVIIPNSVTSLGDSAFSGCTSLTSVTIPNGVTRIEGAAFRDCSSLASVTIPSSVTSIGGQAFLNCTSLASVTIGSGVTSIEYEAFSGTSLNSVYFEDNAPSLGQYAFGYPTFYSLPGTTGWETFGKPTVLWKSQIQAGDASFGVRTNQFGFNITWASGRVVVVEACTELAHPIWSPVGTNTLTDGSSYFSDPQWTNYPGRFYRLRSP